MPLDMEIIADQISRAFQGESWHGPSVREVLAGVSAEDAAVHPIAGAHSIWEIVLHLTSGYILVLRRVRGERAQLSPEEEWPPVAEFSSEAWRQNQHTLEQLNQQLQSAVRAFPAERLSQELGSQDSVSSVLRHASARPVPCRPDRSSQEGPHGVARGGLLISHVIGRKLPGVSLPDNLSILRDFVKEELVSSFVTNHPSGPDSPADHEAPR